MSSDPSILFQPFRLGSLELPNRLVMAPLTRNRATPDTLAPHDLNVAYYRQRASAGLIITEATQISQQGQGYILTPGIYSDAQVEGWTKVTQAVHAAGGRIFLQLWHVGRVSHVSLQPGGAAPVAPSAIQANTKTYLDHGFDSVSMPRALDAEEIPLIVRDYYNAALNAKRAGFDGVEIHGANGYLIDQFLRDGSNARTDAYGGSIENRVRFAVEVAEAVLKVWEPGRVGFRISPVSPSNDMRDSDPAALFGYLAKCLSALNLGYLHVNEGLAADNAPFDFAAIRSAFKGAYIANFGYTRARAAEAVAANRADLVAFGKLYIANPDLVARFKSDVALNEPDQKTFYGGDQKGYTDYPVMLAG
ncbi:MAG: alkene reductase [Beijerinckiaceae bacterium]|jgi:N-ethylmaleimide reductase|nr:alkene reductase [Beijerinckiaceae bacterium]MDO9441491.1 alkene reductase [Beijerinckiaceae bacterium]